MAEEPENLVLVQLRDMRALLAGQSARFDRVDARFDALERRFDDVTLLLNHALGLGTSNAVKLRGIDARQQATDAWQRQVDTRIDELERRLGSLEERTDG